MKIEKEAAADVEMLQDLVTAAVNEAARKVDAAMQSQLGGTAGRNGPAPRTVLSWEYISGLEMNRESKQRSRLRQVVAAIFLCGILCSPAGLAHAQEQPG